MLQHPFISCLALISIPLVIVTIDKFNAHELKKIFNLGKEMRSIRRNKPKLPTPIKKENNGTLIGYNGKREIIVPDTCKHVFIAGTTGSGKTVTLSNFIQRATEQNFPTMIIDGKGDIGEGSLLDITTRFCNKYQRKLYIINLSDPQHSDQYNPFQNSSPTTAKDMLVNLTEWSEEHYKSNTERFLQRLVVLMDEAGIDLSFKTILKYLNTDGFDFLSASLLKSETITKQDHMFNLEISKACGKIAEQASARFSTIAESEIGSILSENGIDIYTALQEKAVILFILNPLIYPEISPLMGKLILTDARKAVSKLFNSNQTRVFFVCDEISNYACPALLDLVNKSRSAGITNILATQSLSDMDNAVNEYFKEQIIENCNNYIVMRQNSSVNAEHWASILGTRATLEVTYQLEQQTGTTAQTGLGSAKRVREFLYHPDDIKSLSTGKAFYLSRDQNFHCKLNVNKPF